MYTIHSDTIIRNQCRWCSLELLMCVTVCHSGCRPGGTSSLDWKALGWCAELCAVLFSASGWRQACSRYRYIRFYKYQYMPWLWYGSEANTGAHICSTHSKSFYTHMDQRRAIHTNFWLTPTICIWSNQHEAKLQFVEKYKHIIHEVIHSQFDQTCLNNVSMDMIW